MIFPEIIRNPPERTLRQFAALWLIVFGGMGIWKLATGGAATSAYALIGAALAVGLGGLAVPRAVRWIFVGWMTLAFPVGWLISHAVLALVYFGLFTPIALVFRFMRRDRLRMKKPDVSSYWLERPPIDDAVRYFKQF